MSKKSPWPDRLRAIRKRNKLTQRAAAEKIGAAVRTWINWENGYRTPAAASQKIIAIVFGSRV